MCHRYPYGHANQRGDPCRHAGRHEAERPWRKRHALLRFLVAAAQLLSARARVRQAPPMNPAAGALRERHIVRFLCRCRVAPRGAVLAPLWDDDELSDELLAYEVFLSTPELAQRIGR